MITIAMVFVAAAAAISVFQCEDGTQCLAHALKALTVPAAVIFTSVLINSRRYLFLLPGVSGTPEGTV